MRNRIFTTFILLGILVVFGGCNTIHGIGKDIEQGGKKTQEVADSVKNKM